MDKLVKIKHSLIDWDYKTPTYLAISDLYKVSLPTSLCSGGAGGVGHQEWIFLKSTLAPCIKEGRIVTYVRRPSVGFNGGFFFFRVQALPTNANPANCYRVWNYGTEYFIQQIVAGVVTTLKTGAISPTLPYGSWYKERVTWWESIAANLGKFLRILYEKDIGAGWQEIATYDHTANLWSASAVNRVGLYLMPGSLPNCLFNDDTEVWKGIT